MYLIWSNQKRMWWRAGNAGYTEFIEEAGRYSLIEAKEIVRAATVDGMLGTREINPVTSQPYTRQNEALVLSPEGVETARRVMSQLVDRFTRLTRLYHELGLAARREGDVTLAELAERHGTELEKLTQQAIDTEKETAGE